MRAGVGVDETLMAALDLEVRIHSLLWVVPKE